MQTTSKKRPEILEIEAAEGVLKSLSTLRAELRRQSHPTDPERIARLQNALVEQMKAMSSVRGLMAKLQWETIRLSEQEHERLMELSRRLAAERRQIKKMLR